MTRPHLGGEALEALVGEWEGTYRLWLEPGEPRVEGPTSCTGQPVLGGRFVSLSYDWTDLDGPQQGVMLLGRTHESRWQMSWIDTWHMGHSILHCEGDVDNEVLGSYGPADEPWGWRTSFEVGDTELVVTAWNISPAGDETKATEASYRRVP